jgi:hypothetical protein
MILGRKRLIITEDEKKNILNLYGLISEQVTKNYEIFGNSFFGDGKWMELNPDTKKDLDNQIKQSIEFLSKNKSKIGTIQITASESRVPNYDQEKKSPQYNKSLPVLELSRRRAETMKKYMLSAFKGALDVGIISQLPEFTEPILLQGETKYDPKNPGNPIHNKERYVKVDVSLQTKDEPQDIPPLTPSDCARDMKIRIYYDPKEHGNSHTCNSSIYEVYVNDVLVNRDGDNKPYISLNNAGLLDDAGYTVLSQEITDKSKSKGNKTIYKKVYLPKSKNAGGARSNTITITNELYNSIPNINKGVNIKFVCRNISKWLPTPSDLINSYPEIPGEFFTASTVNGTLYNGTQMTYKDGEWFHATNWKFGCHRAVGSIDITNNEGKTVTIPLKTPTEKDEELTYKSIDPCTLKFKE